MRLLLACRPCALEPVHENKQQQPDNVDEMPVPRGGFEREMMLRVEMTAESPQEHDRQHDCADRHVKAVEPGQHEERRAVDSRRQLEVELAVSVAVLVGLESKKGKSDDDGDEKP